MAIFLKVPDDSESQDDERRSENELTDERTGARASGGASGVRDVVTRFISLDMRSSGQPAKIQREESELPGWDTAD